jgi:endonuclease YncB( thermonuclease family)
MKYLVLVLLYSCQLKDSQNLHFVRSIDGDSFVLKYGNLKSEIRLYGVSCPELYQKGLHRKSPEGERAKSKLENLIHVHGMISFEQVTIDHFNRPLLIVTAGNGKTLNEMMIENGNCGFYERAQSYKDNAFRSELKNLSLRMGRDTNKE